MAIRRWRRNPDDPARREALIQAIDKRDDALDKVSSEDLRLATEQPEARDVPGQ